MTEREFNLRSRIDTLIDERDWYKARVPRPTAKGYPSWCVFCGAKTKTVKYPATCRGHSDLPALDSFYDEFVA